METCNTCNKDFTYKQGHNSHSKCAPCVIRETRHKRKQKLLDLKGGKCERCGYEKCRSALTFHHIDPLTKSFTIGGNHTRKWKTLVEEIEKCILVCANCHAEIHENMLL